MKLEFGKAASPVEVGFTRVTPEDVYSEERGLGRTEVHEYMSEADQGSGTDLRCDFIYGHNQTGAPPAESLLDLALGTHQVALMAGDMRYNRGGPPFDVPVDGETAEHIIELMP